MFIYPSSKVFSEYVDFVYSSRGRQVQKVEAKQGQIRNRIAPKIQVKPQDESLEIKSSKKLVGDYELLEEGRFFTYLLLVDNLDPGTNVIELDFEDRYGNIVTEKVTIYKRYASSTLIGPFPGATLTYEGNELLALVSKKYQLLPDFVPDGLVELSEQGDGISTTGQMSLRRIVVDDFLAMFEDMQEDGIDISVSSAYRSYETQEYTFLYWVKYNGGSIEAADRISARPGHSEHQLGTTLDIVTAETNYRLGENFANTRAGKWLQDNAYKYGFVMSYPQGQEDITGYKFEPWHWRYIGKENAIKHQESGLNLIEYLESLN